MKYPFIRKSVPIKRHTERSEVSLITKSVLSSMGFFRLRVRMTGLDGLFAVITD